MIERIKEFCFYIVLGFCLAGISNLLDSDFLGDYLKDNLITLLVALLAINTTTSSVVMTKLKDITDAAGGNFNVTIEQLKLSIYEQVGLIVFAVLLLILSGSKGVVGLHAWMPFMLSAALASVFIAALYALFDTAKSIFVILKHENKNK